MKLLSKTFIILSLMVFSAPAFAGGSAGYNPAPVKYSVPAPSTKKVKTVTTKKVIKKRVSEPKETTYFTRHPLASSKCHKCKSKKRQCNADSGITSPGKGKSYSKSKSYGHSGGITNRTTRLYLDQ